MGLRDWIARSVERDAARDEQAARARRMGAQALREGGVGSGLAAWARESTGSTRNGHIQMPRVECGHCHTSRVKRADGRPAAHKYNGAPCPGGGEER